MDIGIISVMNSCFTCLPPPPPPPPHVLPRSVWAALMAWVARLTVLLMEPLSWEAVGCVRTPEDGGELSVC